MTVMMSLRSRLALARLALSVPGDRVDPERMGRLLAAGVHLLVLGESGDDDLDVSNLMAWRQNMARPHLLTATSNGGIAKATSADLVHIERPGWKLWGDYPRGHEWTLLGRGVRDVRTVRRPGDVWDYLFVGPWQNGDGAASPLIREAVEQQPPLDHDALPWFALGDWTGDEVDELIAAGVRRIAFSGELLDHDDAEERLATASRALTQAWQDDEAAEAYRLSAVRL